MNRKARREAAARHAQQTEVPTVLLSLACAGSLSSPRQDCNRAVVVSMPFDLEALRAGTNQIGWFVSIITPPGQNPPAVTVLCPACADALIPELAAVARQARPGLA